MDANTQFTSENGSEETRPDTNTCTTPVETNPPTDEKDLNSPEMTLATPITNDDLELSTEQNNNKKLPHKMLDTEAANEDFFTVPFGRPRSSAFTSSVDDHTPTVTNTSNDSPSTKAKKGWHKTYSLVTSFGKRRPKSTNDSRPKSANDTPDHSLHNVNIANKEKHKLWQCANCQRINESIQFECWGCKLSCGDMAIGELFCQSCSLKVFTRDQTTPDSAFCPQCYKFLGKK